MDNRTEASSRELLETLVKGQRKALRHSRIVTILCLLLAALLVIAELTAVPRVTAALERLDGAFTELEGAMGTLDRLDAALSTVEGAVGNLNVLPDMFSSFDSTMGQLDGLIENAEALSEAAARLGEMDIESLNSGIRHISQIDFETLNQAIKDLADVVQPLAQFANLFG